MLTAARSLFHWLVGFLPSAESRFQVIDGRELHLVSHLFNGPGAPAASLTVNQYRFRLIQGFHFLLEVIAIDVGVYGAFDVPFGEFFRSPHIQDRDPWVLLE